MIAHHTFAKKKELYFVEQQKSPSEGFHFFKSWST